MEKWTTAESQIEGVGVYSTGIIHKDELVDIGLEYLLYLIPTVTYFGSKINHSYLPNVVLRSSKDNTTMNIYAKRFISPFEELTMDYNDTPFYIMKPFSHWKAPHEGYTTDYDYKVRQ